MFRARTVIPVLAAVAFFASAEAQAQDHKFKFFITADWVSPLGDDEITFGSVQDAVQGSDDFGYEGGFEWRMNKLVGIEVSYLIGSNDFELEEFDTELGTVDQQAVTAALNFHILPTKVFDLWIAPIASWYTFGDFDFDDAIDSEDVELDSEWGYGAAVGFDIGLGKTVAITGGVRYVKLDLASDGFDNDLAFDPVIARVGLAFRFGER